MLIDSLAGLENLDVMSIEVIGQNHPVQLNRFEGDSTIGGVAILSMSESHYCALGGVEYCWPPGVFQLVNIRRSGRMEYADAREQVVAMLRLRKKLEIVRNRAVRLRAGLNGARDLAALSAIDSTIYVQRFRSLPPRYLPPADSVLEASIPQLKVGEISPVITGNTGCYVMLLDSIHIPTSTSDPVSYQGFMDNWNFDRRSEWFHDWLSQKREQANIRDYR
jgi:hypothetical protein